MDPVSLAATAVALAMDAFAVALMTGVVTRKLTPGHYFRMAFHFGLFQALMPLLGWFGGAAVYHYLSSAGPWIAFGLLAFIGVKMLVSGAAGSSGKPGRAKDPTRGLSLAGLSVATSLDALAVGFSLAVIGNGILVPCLVIGVTAAVFTILGMSLGSVLSLGYGGWAEIGGGIVLVIIGLKMVLF
ncbi:MAG: manganese efflux pump [Deltaproteobacteria bacterium]|nr:manganese efflux pump [Deltaproteobacteria bacterium]